MSDAQDLRQTPLDRLHRALGARMTAFAGFAMPLQYAEGIIAEHLHCRERAALFDVSHMGQVSIRPRDGDMRALAAAIEAPTPADIAGLAEGRQRYALLTTGDGGIRDDVMVARLSGRFLVVVNAALREADAAYLAESLPEAEVALAEDRALLALQGPEAEAVLAPLAPGVGDMRFMDVRETTIDGIGAVVARSGYTGEDGFEISVAADEAPRLFETLAAHEAVKPAGLGARDTLRLEAGLPLMGSDLDAGTSPVEAGLVWAVGRARRPGGSREGGFPGAARILAEIANGPERRRVGLLPEGRTPVRAGAALSSDGEDAGMVTSGGFSPSLGRPVAMAYVPAALAEPGTPLEAGQRGRRIPVTVAALPFVRPRRKR